MMQRAKPSVYSEDTSLIVGCSRREHIKNKVANKVRNPTLKQLNVVVFASAMYW